MKWNFIILLGTLVLISLVAEKPLLPDVILLSSITFILFLLFYISHDSLFFLGGAITLFSSIGASSFGYNPYSLFTILLFMVPVFLSIIFMETLINEFIRIKDLTKQVTFSVILSILFIFVFGIYSIQERNIISLSLILAMLVIAVYYFLEALSSKDKVF
ncbi:MAG: hypothetical protein ACP5SF_04935 [Thermoplasmata archaeon]